MSAYKYKPLRFYSIVFLLTWAFWFSAVFLKRNFAYDGAAIVLMLLGLFVPCITAIITIMSSKSPELKRDFKDKMFGAFRVKPKIVLLSIAVFGIIIIVSILLSTMFGQSLNQFSFVGGFSFAIGGIPTFFTLVVAAFLEELGWRGYAEDSIAYYCSWWKESLIFGLVWSLWHFPLFLIPDTYQWQILQQNPWFVVYGKLLCFRYASGFSDYLAVC
jgi:membrane protease YdiL (CAAX protease family)